MPSRGDLQILYVTPMTACQDDNDGRGVCGVVVDLLLYGDPREKACPARSERLEMRKSFQSCSWASRLGHAAPASHA